MFRFALLGALALGIFAAPARADGIPFRCIDIAVPKGAIAAHDGQWIALTRDQWQFLRGVYVVNPETPPGLPYGDRAVLATIPGNQSAMIFFIDGDKACTPMPIPAELTAMLRDVATDALNHEAAPSDGKAL